MRNRNIRRAIVLNFFVILSLVTKAQLSIGIKGGPDFGRLLDALEAYNGGGGTVMLNSASRTSFLGGFFLDIPLSKANMFYLRPQLEYLGGGGKLPLLTDYSGNVISSPETYNLSYADVPVQFLFSPTLGIVKPWIGAGFYGGVLMNASDKGGNGSGTLRIGNNSNDDIERFDFGYTFTAGLSLKWGFLVGADFQHGLTRISPPAESGNPRLNTRNSVLGVHVGYKWTIK
jgi:hypothetical protein